MHKIILINGPRRSGKDTAARHMEIEWPNTRHRKFSGGMKAAMKAQFAITEELWKELEVGPSSPAKEQPRPEFFGMSWRELLIWFSEEVMKPKFGNDVFGKLMVQELMKHTPAPYTVMSDCGFIEEVLPVINAMGAKNCYVFRPTRDMPREPSCLTAPAEEMKGRDRRRRARAKREAKLLASSMKEPEVVTAPVFSSLNAIYTEDFVRQCNQEFKEGWAKLTLKSSPHGTSHAEAKPNASASR